MVAACRENNTAYLIPQSYLTTMNPSSSDQSQTCSSACCLIRTPDAIAPAILRLTLAAVMLPHGAQKLLGLFGGYGFKGTMGFFTGTMGIPWLLAFGVIVIEFFAPILLLLGLGTRLAALGLGVVMSVAMILVHAQYGFFMNWFGAQKGEGIEYFLLAIGISVALLVSGAGRWSIDRNLSSH